MLRRRGNTAGLQLKAGLPRSLIRSKLVSERSLFLAALLMDVFYELLKLWEECHKHLVYHRIGELLHAHSGLHHKHENHGNQNDITLCRCLHARFWIFTYLQEVVDVPCTAMVLLVPNYAD